MLTREKEHDVCCNGHAVRKGVNVPTHLRKTKYFPSHFRIEVFNLVIRGTRSPTFVPTFPQSHAVNRTRAKGVMTPLASQEPRPRSFNKGNLQGSARARARARGRGGAGRGGEGKRISGATCSGPRVNFCSSEVNKTESVHVRCVQPEDYSALESPPSAPFAAKGAEGRGNSV